MRAFSRPWFPLLALLAAVGLVALATLAPRPAAVLPAAPDWTGTWDTRWQAGGATVFMTQRGETVTGSYPLYKGVLEGRVVGDRLIGTWTQPTRRGGFEMLMASDGQTFAGRFENDQYWNGARLAPGEGRSFERPDLRSPRDTIASFMNAIYWARKGQHERLQAALTCVDFDETEEQAVRVKSSWVQLLYSVLDRTTFGLGDFEGREDVLDHDLFSIDLAQAGSEVRVPIEIHRSANEQDWRIAWPGQDALEQALLQLSQARGETRVDPHRHHRLQSPRATMQTFLEESARWSSGGAQLVQECLDLSEVDASVRKLDAQLHAFTLKRTLDAIGYVHLWGIPDDPRDTLPYVHYSHALGDITIAPRRRVSDPPDDSEEPGASSEAALDAPRWAFTTETLASLKPLFDAIEPFGVTEGAHALSSDPYFRLRTFARSISPHLAARNLGLENWQWAGLFILGVMGWLLAALVHSAARRIVIGPAKAAAMAEIDASRDDGSSVEWRFFVPARIALTAGAWLVGLRYLGLPDRLQIVLLTVTLVATVLGLVWLSIALISSVSQRLLIKARRTHTRVDEILVTLLASIAKIVAVVLGLILLAEGLALPYQSVLAGIGIGGLAVAIAARDTVANFFGSAVLISDRPFKRGDLVEVMGHVGEVERVGIRSTHIRTYDDSVVVIPNSSLVNELIDNRGRRRRRKVDVIVGVQYDSPPAKVQKLVEELKALVAKQPFGAGDATLVGLWDFSASSIDVRLWCYLDVQTLGQERAERHRLLLDVVRLVEELGLSFAFPTRTLHLESTPESHSGEESGMVRLGAGDA